MNYVEQYRSKMVSCDKAVQVVKSGDWVDYNGFAGQPYALDKALAKRKDELKDVKIRTLCGVYGPPAVVQVDPKQEHFIQNSWHFSGGERKLYDNDLCNYIPMVYRELPSLYRNFCDVDVLMLQVAPMDNHGYFNYGLQNSATRAAIEKAKVVIVEVNENMPRIYGGSQEAVHISEVNYIVEGENQKLPQLPAAPIGEVDQKVAENIVAQIENGSVIQLGIGGMPNAVGKMIAKSDLKDLGVQTEMMVDAYLDMYEAGNISGKYKNIDKYKMVFAFCLGSQRLYDFLNENHQVASYPVDYTNLPSNIALNDKQISINNAVEIDIFGQVCSESSGTRHISGTGGQMDWFEGAYLSKGGKAFVCLSSTFKDKAGNNKSRIKPILSPGAIVTTPRTVAFNIVTEYGIAVLKGKSTWERAEALVNIAHPDYRDELIAEADKMKIWRRSNKN